MDSFAFSVELPGAYTVRVKLGRTLLALLLCVAVPLSATAGMFVPAACPATPSSHESAASPLSACCDSGVGHKSTPCKSGAECKACASSSLAPGRCAITTFPSSHIDSTDFRTVLIPIRNPTGLWRPPRAA
ncbi:MAG: hypothetical protein JSR15_11790 [Proteobacteria bacterium]|nr:hypothetical protein [Pseudomonadota bacterium]